ncbi:MAG: type I-C CRISPR-associated protein Cas8c/Csd1 [Desulfobacteraceae bacterium]|nr:type I-C CRISPR-associated protein Cas8c/Csd1 [Desulfobacteraceae bacterium]
MILSSLTDYYDRMVQDPGSGMPEPGFSEEKISFALILDTHGGLINIMDLRDISGKTPRARKMKVPASVKRAVNIAPNFLWDNTGYVLCVDGKGKPERTAQTFDAFKERHRAIAERYGNSRLKAVSSFLKGWSPGRFCELDLHEAMLDQNLVFWMAHDESPVHAHPSVQGIWQELNQSNGSDGYVAPCLVRGEAGPIARLHPAIKGVTGAQPAGASIVSFNLDAFTSYGKKQSFNAPVSEEAAFAYTSALNYMLRRENGRYLQIGDSSTVFWAERETPAEDLLTEMFDLSGASEENPGEGEAVQVTNRVRSYLTALRDGTPINGILGDVDPDTRFYILGLSPNKSRIAVRFWLPSTFGTIARRVSEHYRYLSIERQFKNQPEFPALWQLLLETAVQQKKDNIPPLLSGALTRCVLTGNRYPESLYSAVIGRIRADKQITYLRAAILKACLLRNHPEKAGEITMSLNQDRTDTPYLLGRLFSLLEKAQTDALGKNLNTTIRKRFFGAASATPSVVFPQLLRLAQHHIAKSEYGGIIDRKVQEVMQAIDDFPSRLSLREQGVFTIGYYHQNNANYQKTEKE